MDDQASKVKVARFDGQLTWPTWFIMTASFVQIALFFIVYWKNTYCVDTDLYTKNTGLTNRTHEFTDRTNLIVFYESVRLF